MKKYVGLYTQQRSNNMKSMLLLILFPVIILVLVFAFYAIIESISSNSGSYDSYYGYGYSSRSSMDWDGVVGSFLSAVPWVVGGVAIWFIIAYTFNSSMIRHATGAHSLARMENPRVYNIVENLTMTCGMPMPQINIMNTPELNAFASGIDNKSYTVTVTTGLLQRLNDEELAGVIGHELSHIRNRDTRLLIVSIIFVGIMSTVLSLLMRFLWNTFLWGGGGSRRSKDGKDSGVSAIVVLIIGVVLAALGYFFTLLTRFAISRKREYMADAGGAEMCGNPRALANALRKISGMPAAAPEGREDIAQLYIIHPQSFASGISGWFNNLFSTHPSTERRIEFLERL